MKSITKFIGLLLLGALILSSCSKPKYTASFSPSKYKRYTSVKPIKENVAVKKSIEESNVELLASINEEQSTLPVAKIEKESVKVESHSEPFFTRKETKQRKRAVRRKLFNAAKKSLAKRPTNEDKLIPIILSLFPVLCLIGIYIYQNETITNDFWLDLLLHLTFFGAIIYALLVVLDLVTIA